MVVNQIACSWLEQKSLIKSLAAKNCKPCEISQEYVMSILFTNGLGYQEPESKRQ